MENNQNIAPLQCDNLDMILKRFDAWWENKSIGRPMMRIVGKLEEPLGPLEEMPAFVSYEDEVMNFERKLIRMRNTMKTHKCYAEAFQQMPFYMGAGSLAAYMGSRPGFNKDTIWFHPCLEDASNLKGIVLDENKWYQQQLQDMKKARDIGLAEGFLLTYPDMIENLDVYSSLRGAQDSCFDVLDEPDILKEAIYEIDNAYIKAYTEFGEAMKRPDDLMSYTFALISTKKVAKVQCDFSAMLSESQFVEFVLPSLKRQTDFLDHALYHLDGKDAVRHLEYLLEIDKISAIQWEGGAGRPHSGSEEYYPIYDRIKAGNRALNVFLNFGTLPDWIRTADRMIERYGNQGIYFNFKDMTQREAEYIMEYAQKHWTTSE
ncbi:MAG: hypothetical protein R3Y47_08990 [Lachnospiraceae bacterium]